MSPQVVKSFRSFHSFRVSTLYDGLRNEIEQQMARHKIGMRFLHKDILSPAYFNKVAKMQNSTAPSINHRFHELAKPALAHDVITSANRSSCASLVILSVCD